jgi:hypothetical protein
LVVPFPFGLAFCVVTALEPSLMRFSASAMLGSAFRVLLVKERS